MAKAGTQPLDAGIEPEYEIYAHTYNTMYIQYNIHTIQYNTDKIHTAYNMYTIYITLYKIITYNIG